MNRKITIAGGGLAGLALGIALRRQDIPVELFEAGSYPRHRVCGEFLCGVREETLDALGIGDLLEGAHRIEDAAWFRKERCILRHDLPLPARGISRHVLDHQLAIRFQETGGILQENQRLLPETWTEPGTVVATGRQPATRGDLIGLKVHLRGFPLNAGLEMHCSPEGYIGLCEVDGDRVNASALFRVRPGLKAPRHELQRAYLLACGMGDLVARMDAAQPDPDSYAAVSGLSPGRLRLRFDPSLCAAGDRFAMIGPFTGNGMSMALESAEVMSGPLARYATGRVDWDAAVKEANRLQAKRFQKRLAVSASLHAAFLSGPALGAMAALAGIGCFPVNFFFRQLR